MPIDDDIEKEIKEENPQAEAVRSLINVAPRKAGQSDTEIELKTDLDENEVKLHTACDIMANVLEMKPLDFSSKSVISPLVNKKERKALSKMRKSRGEIVEVARNRDNIFQDQDQEGKSFMRRWFSPRPRPPV